MRESCLVYCYSGIQSLVEVVLLCTFYTVVFGGRNMHVTDPSRLLSSSGCGEQLSINNRAFGEWMFCKR